jgi:hypothetical protein
MQPVFIFICRRPIQKRLVDVLRDDTARPLAAREVTELMSATTVKLLRAAAEIVGDTKLLAIRLGVPETLIAQFLADVRQLHDPLLLRAVDIILADRQSRASLPADTAAQSFQESRRDRFPGTPS